ncbi:amino acid adenylation domain-containing protein [Corallococcus caeni]|uniref:amino acid adenylation domain-containing protein n=1 Tax=Corallococcus caeni TaxID=3082388 RepID=UPI0030C6D42C
MGRAIANSQVYLLDRFGQPTPFGVPGEVFLGGEGLARGYLGQPALTAERFVPNPFSTSPGARLYRTGDLARWRADGQLEFLGRNDNQVKLRGFRIELGEIEATLARQPGVREVAVLVREDVLGDKRLVAYLVLAPDAPSVSELRRALQQQLPGYMVPAHLLPLDALPLTPNGKLDRRALPAPDARPSLDTGFVAPQSALEVQLASAWQAVLRLDKVGVHDNFFDLGGNSLLATQVVSRLRDQSAISVPLHVLFQAPTLSGLARHLQAHAPEARSLQPSFKPRPDGPLPLSFAQERLWFIDQLLPGNPLYVMPLAVRLTGTLDATALAHSLRALVERHESLRTTFGLLDDKPVQLIAPALDVPLPIIDLRSLPADEQSAAVTQHTQSFAVQPFDLHTGPLLRSCLLRLADDSHLWLLSLHHIVADGWSLGVLVQEVAALYASASRGELASLPALPIQYADYALWQREWLQGPARQPLLDYWTRQLSDVPTVLELPTDFPRPAIASSRGALQPLQLPVELTAALKALSREEGVTLFMTLMAAFQVLLQRYCAKDDFVVGTPIANRTLGQTEALIGCFVNTLPIRANLSGQPSFRALLRRVQATCLEAYAHQELPFEHLVDALHLARDLSHTPLVQVLFVLQNAPMAAPALPGLHLEPLPTRSTTAKFDLTLNLEETSGGLTGWFEYRTELFRPETIERLTGQLQTLLEGIVAAPNQSLTVLPVLSERERQQVLVEFNANTTAYPSDSIASLFHAQAASTPDALALLTADASLTYRALSERASRLAHHLRHLGVGPEVTVGVFLERSPDLIVSLLAILSAGGAYLPLDTSYPSERLAFMLEDSGASLVLSHSALAPRLPSGSPRTLCLDEVADEIASRPSFPPPLSVSPQGLAYVIYTSGSTGRPKGVSVPHQAVIRLVKESNYFALRADDVVLHLAPTAFDASTFEVWAPLLNGARLALFPASPPSAESLAHAVSLFSVSTLWLTAGLFHQLVDSLDDSLLPLLRPLRTLLAGGDVLSASHVRAWLSRLPHCTLVNGYGPTENTTFTCCAPLSDASQVGASVPLGRPISNTSVFVLDRFGQPSPIGVPGELFAGGDGLARGYRGQPALTAERFVPNPFSASPGARLYRTGDLARWRADGQLEFLGRNDNQVKLRGFRIELGEIEAALARQSGVREVAVLVREDVPGDKRLVAYLVLAPDAPSVSELRRALQQQLPGYMVPAHLLPLDAFPLTPNGKLDRRALPAPDARPSLDTGFVAPQSALEVQLASAWQAVLRLDKVGVHDNFFDLGGNSLLATQVVSRLRDRFAISVPLQAFFQAPSISRLTRHLQAHAPEAQSLQPSFKPRPDGPLPLSFAQERLWFIDRLIPDSALYAIPLAVRLTGTLDATALAHSLRALVERHESLRTTFGLVDDKPVQLIAPALDVPLPIIDLCSLPADEQSAAVTQHTQSFAAQPFDLHTGPLLRSCLLRLADDSHLWLLSLHHIVADGWSLGVLIQEVAALYASASRGEPASLPALPIQYADYALWQREWLQGPARQPLLDYWTRQLADVPTVLELPTDFPRPAVPSPQGALHALRFPPELTASLKALSRAEGITLFMTLMAAFQVLLQRYCAKDDFVVGTPIANRTRSETESLIGCFINTLPIRANLSGQPSFRALLRRVQATCLEAYAHQELPFEHLVDALHLSRDLRHTPLVQVLFVLQNAPMSALALPGLNLEPLPTQSTTAKFDLTLNLEEDSGGLAGWFEYRTGLFAASTIARFAEQFATLLAGVVAAPDADIHTLPVLSERERQQVLVEFNANTSAYPSDSIASLFHAQAASTPDALALLSADASLTYRALSERAGRLAHHLRHLGVGPEVTVGVFIERSHDLIVSLLAILSAGGAYLPLDTSYPSERLAFMLEDSGASLVLSHSALRDRLPTGAHRVLCLDEVQSEVDSRPSSPPASTLSSQGLAYVIYTSGSTGRPKGVSVPHQAVIRLVKESNYFALRADDVVLHLAPTAFDASTFEVWAPLLNGARLALFPASPPSAESLAHAVSLFNVSTLWLTAGLFHQLVDSLDDSLLPLLRPLRTLLAGGDVLSASHVRAWLSRLPHCTLVNGYGPTENTTFTCCAPLSDASQVGASVPLGRPISNTSVFVLDRFGQPSPIGVPGELFAGGDGLARGYLGQPVLTAERFVPNPFSTSPGARLYRTGDLARWRADGQLEFLGRRDNQVKLRGFRIELGEIEAALARQSGVREVAVLVREDVPGDKRLVAYLVLAPDAPSVSELRRALQQQLPGYMVPAHLLPLDAFPLTPNGKLDRRALPAPDARPSLDTGFVAPQSALEVQLASAWQAVLRLDKVGVHDNFFDLGGNSLLMVQLHTRLREALKLDVPLVELFQAPTIRSLAKHVTQQAEAGSFEHSQDRATNRKASMKNQRALRERNKTSKK